MAQDFSFAAVVDTVASRAGARLAIREVGRDWRYADLRTHSQQVSMCLEAAGQQPGQRVALMAPNSGAFVAAFLGIVRTGGVVAPLNHAVSAPGIELLFAGIRKRWP